jgi:hypothetical protein
MSKIVSTSVLGEYRVLFLDSDFNPSESVKVSGMCFPATWPEARLRSGERKLVTDHVAIPAGNGLGDSFFIGKDLIAA